MISLYRPANIKERNEFDAKWCDSCDRERGFRKNSSIYKCCSIPVKSIFNPIDSPDYPKEWIVGPNGPACTAYIPDKQFFKSVLGQLNECPEPQESKNADN